MLQQIIDRLVKKDVERKKEPLDQNAIKFLPSLRCRADEISEDGLKDSRLICAFIKTNGSADYYEAVIQHLHTYNSRKPCDIIAKVDSKRIGIVMHTNYGEAKKILDLFTRTYSSTNYTIAEFFRGADFDSFIAKAQLES